MSLRKRRIKSSSISREEGKGGLILQRDKGLGKEAVRRGSRDRLA